jgi:arabinan endo-1,5-alpha-L-arabinosidase
MVGRSKHVQGPYVDHDGVPMMQGGGTQLLVGNERWVGPGGESVLLEPGGHDVLAFHAYDAQTGMRALQISTLTWTDDWPHAALGH